MFLETLDTEKLFTNGLAIIPWRLRLRTSKDTPEKSDQNDLSTERSRSNLLLDFNNLGGSLA